MSKTPSATPAKNFIRWIVHASLQSLGIFDNRLYSIIICTVLTCSMSIGVFGSVIGFFNSAGTIDRLESFTPIFPQLSTLLVFISVNTSGANLKHLLSKLAGEEENVVNIIDQTNPIIKRKLAWLAIIMIIQGTLFTIPGLIFSLRNDSIDDKYSFIVPYWFSCGNQNHSKFLQSMCWRIGNKKWLFVVNTVQMGGVTICNIIYFAAFSLYIVIMEELGSHLKCIKNKLRNLSKIIHTLFEAKRGGISTRLISQEGKLYQDFLIIYQYQQFLNKYLLQSISMWNKFIAFFYINFGINTTLFIFMIFYELNNDKLLCIKVGGLGLELFIMAFIVSNHGQNISQMKEEVFNELRNIPWYKTNIKFQKIYLTMLNLNCAEVSVKIADMYKVNLNSFGSMVKANYSICNMLLLKFGR